MTVVVRLSKYWMVVYGNVVLRRERERERGREGGGGMGGGIERQWEEDLLQY
jgi:hypothetical protein